MATFFFKLRESEKYHLDTVKTPKQVPMNYIYEFGIGQWVWDLYRNGPMLLGFWGGLGDPEVCARLSGNSNAADWMMPSGVVSQACENMIQRSFRGLSVTVNLIMYISCVFLTFATVRQWLVGKAMAKTFAHEFYKMQALSETMVNTSAAITEGTKDRREFTKAVF